MAVGGGFDGLLEFAGRYGFEMVQIALDDSRYFPEKIGVDERRRVAEQFRKMGIGLCFHGPSDIPLMNRHETVRSAGLSRMLEMIDMAVETGGEYFIFHPGRLAFFSVSKEEVIFMEQRIPSRHLDLFSDSARRILDHAGDRIKICLENTYSLPEQFLERIGRLAADDGLYLVWDVGHTELASAGRRERIIRFFYDNIERVKLGHLHDAVERSDHRALGTGKVDIQAYIEIFNTIGADIILEIFPESALLGSIDYLRKLRLVGKA
jgi:sugar phosphate isomerase/epimerase